MVVRIGMIGLSEGNGHPYSFSAIINGYSNNGFAKCGWPVIHNYLKEKSASDFGINDAQITHAWTQDPKITSELCVASKIPTALNDPNKMLGEVDAVIIARDDWNSHYSLAKTFLDKGLSVFIDKPLSLDTKELKYFLPFLQNGKLMSCSGMRFAKELKVIKNLGKLRCIHGTVINNWVRYGVHLLDAVLNTISSRPVAIARNVAKHESFTIAMDDESSFTLDAIGKGPKTFHLSFFGNENHIHIDLNDNFVAFKQTLEAFLKMHKYGYPIIEPSETLLIMQTLMAGLDAVPGGKYVKIRDYKI